MPSHETAWCSTRSRLCRIDANRRPGPSTAAWLANEHSTQMMIPGMTSRNRPSWNSA